MSEAEWLDITPPTNLILQFRGEAINYMHLVGEGVDNALDAAAEKVGITINDNEVTFKDDGRGVLKTHVPSLFSPGNHGAMSTTQLGRFGIGIKAQAINAGDELIVASTSADGRFRALVDWRKVLQGKAWRVQSPKWSPADGASTGTTISITKLRKPPALSMSKLIFDIAQRFYPAIADGKTILLNGERIPLLPEPKMVDVVEQELSLSGGRTAFIRAGIKIDQSPLHKIHLSFRHRVIWPGSPIGCGEASGLNRIFGRLTIDGSWHLDRFKNGITDEEEREELDAAVFDVLRPILEKVGRQTMDGRLTRLAGELNDLIPDDLKVRPRSQGGKVEAEAKKRKRKSGGPVDEDKSTPGGPAKAKSRSGRLLITFDGNAQEHGVGQYSNGKIQRVDLAPDDPFVALLLKQRDEALAVQSLLFVAMTIFDHGRQALQLELPFEGEYGQRISRLMALQSGSESLPEAA